MALALMREISAYPALWRLAVRPATPSEEDPGQHHRRPACIKIRKNYCVELLPIRNQSGERQLLMKTFKIQSLQILKFYFLEMVRRNVS